MLPLQRRSWDSLSSCGSSWLPRRYNLKLGSVPCGTLVHPFANYHHLNAASLRPNQSFGLLMTLLNPSLANEGRLGRGVRRGGFRKIWSCCYRAGCVLLCLAFLCRVRDSRRLCACEGGGLFSKATLTTQRQALRATHQSKIKDRNNIAACAERTTLPLQNSLETWELKWRTRTSEGIEKACCTPRSEARSFRQADQQATRNGHMFNTREN